MKPFYFLLLCLFITFFPSCSKDFLKPYEDRIVGTWNITDIDKRGIGGSSSEVHFRGGTFTFNSDGTLVYIDENGNEYDGTWDVQKRQVNNQTIRTLQISAVDFNTQTVTGEFYDEMNFRGTNHFVAKISSPFRTFVTHFRR